MPCCAGSTASGRRPILGRIRRSWLAESWTSAYGETTARAIAAAHLVEAPLDLSVKADAGLWAERLKAEILPTGSLRLRDSSGAIEALPGFAEGGWWVQDAAAALPAKLLGKPAAGLSSTSAPPPAARRPSSPRRASPSPPSTVRPSACGG